MLYVLRQCVVDAGRDTVDALVREFDDLVARVVHHVAVVPGATPHRVGVAAAVQGVVAGATDQSVAAGTAREGVAEVVGGEDVGEVVTGCTRGAPDQREVLDVSAKRVVEAGADAVDACCRVLDHLIVGVVDDIEIVALATAHHVGTCASVERIVARASRERVVSCQAGE